MAADPTVLPPIAVPNAPLEEESVAVEPVSSTSGIDDSDSVTVTPKGETPLVEAPEVEVRAIEPKVAPKPVPKAMPKAENKPVPAGKGTVNDIALRSTKDRFMITVHCDRPVGDISYMNLHSPRRLVIDLREPWEHNAQNVIRSSTGVVKHVITGEHPDRFRLVVHFRKPPQKRLSPRFARVGNKLVITVPN